jgi:CheY-like chemotaxis protein
MSPLPDGLEQTARILIVDDERHNRQLLELMLTPEGFAIQTAASGDEALALVAAQPPDLIVLDIMMPGMDGYQAIQAIRAMDEFASLPIVAVTGKVVGGERDRCLAAGANDYVPKPVDTVELLAAIGPWLRTAAS